MQSSTTPRQDRHCNPRVAHAAHAVTERLEERRLLTALTPAQIDYTWDHLTANQRNLVAVTEYLYPEFAAKLTAELSAANLPTVTPTPGSLPSDSTAAKGKQHRRPPHHKLPHPKPHHRHHGKTGPTPPVVTNVNYYYDQALPNQLAITFDQDVTASSWNSAISVLDLNTGATIPVSGTYSSALDTVVYDLNSSNELPDAGNYAAIVHGSQITDKTYALPVVGSDSVPGHDYTANFFFLKGETSLNPSVRAIGLADYTAVVRNFGNPTTYSGGDITYAGTANLADYGYIVAHFGTTLSLLTTPDIPTAYIASSSSADIFWDAPASTLVTQYDFYRDSTRIATGVTDTGYLDTSLTSSTTYAYFIVGKDASGDSSWQSPELVMDIVPTMPSLTISGTPLSSSGATYSLVGTLANATAGATQTWSVDWGDGSFPSTYTGTGNTFQHVYSLPADDYPIGVQVSQVVDNANYLFDDGLEVSVSGSLPSVSATGASSFVVGGTYTLAASLANPDGSTVQGWTIDWGDATDSSTYSGSSSTFTHAFAETAAGGTYTIRAVAETDMLGEFPATLLISDADPRASVTGATAAVAGSPYSLIGSYAAPLGGTPTQWTIEWGDGASSTYTGSATSFTHVYTEASPASGYPIAAVAEATGGTQYAADWLTVQVAASTPTVALTASTSTVTVGSNLTVISTFTDPAGTTADAWQIAWGDGTSSYFNGSPSTLAHAYTLPGAYTLAATASTTHATYGTSLVTHVADHGTFSISAPSGTAGAGYVINVNFSDPGSTEAPVSYTINWGDGTTSTHAASPDPEGTFAHTYLTYGTQSITATVATGQDTYIRTAVVSIAAPPANFYATLIGTTAAENDVPYTLFVGMPGLPEPQYTIDWGDGSSSNSHLWYATHEYTYDTNPTHSNLHVATLTANGGYTLYHAPIVYQSGGDGVASIAGNPSASIGTFYTATASFSDDAQHYPWATGAALLYVSWGDGKKSQLSGTTLGVGTHLYDRPGSYTVELDAVYQDDNTDPTLGVPVYEDIDNMDVVVHDMRGVFNISGGTTIAEGQTYTVTESFVDIYHTQTPQQWSVDWGDGQSTVHQGVSPGTFTHVYDQKGFKSVLGSMQTESDNFSAYTYVTVTGPTVGISGGGAAYEQGRTASTVIFSRSTITDRPLNVSFSIGGTASPSDYVVIDASSGGISDGVVTIPPGESFATIQIRPVDDSTPEWTETALVTLGTSAAYDIVPPYTTATVEIVDNDLSLTINAPFGPDGNPVVDVNNDNDSTKIVPVTLDFPPFESGAEITFTADTTKFNIWDSAAKSNLILSGTTNSVVWTYGSGPDPQHTYYAEAIGASSGLGDAVFTLSDSDADATPTVAYSTSNTATANATGRKLAIYWGSQDITGNTSANAQKVITGEEIVLRTDASPSAAWPPKGSSFNWSIPGTAYRWYDIGLNAARTYGLATNADSIAVFWSDAGDHSNPNSITSEQIGVTLNGASRHTTINVVKPVATVSGSMPATQLFHFPIVGANAERGYIGPHDPNVLPGQPDGAQFSNPSPQVPTGFTGDWFWVQTASFNYQITETNNQTHTASVANEYDAGKYPYPIGSTSLTWDIPRINARTDRSKQLSSSGFVARMYLMFKPNLGSFVSHPIPIRYLQWNWGGSATSAGGQPWVAGALTPSTYTTLSSTIGATEPEWSTYDQPLPWTPQITNEL